MATLNEIAYNILNIARSGRSSDDDTISINQIKHWVHYYRGSLLQNYTANGRKIHPNCLQILRKEIVSGSCANEGIIRQVPGVLSFNGQRAIERVESCLDDQGTLCDCKTHLPTNKNRIRFQKYNRFTHGNSVNSKNIFRWYIEPQGFTDNDKMAIILPDWNSDMNISKVWAVFSNPEDIEGYDADHEYPFPNELVQTLVENILAKELGVIVRLPSDELNDSRGVVTQAPAAKVKTSAAKTK